MIAVSLHALINNAAPVTTSGMRNALERGLRWISCLIWASSKKRLACEGSNAATGLQNNRHRGSWQNVRTVRTHCYDREEGISRHVVSITAAPLFLSELGLFHNSDQRCLVLLSARQSPNESTVRSLAFDQRLFSKGHGIDRLADCAAPASVDGELSCCHHPLKVGWTLIAEW